MNQMNQMNLGKRKKINNHKQRYNLSAMLLQHTFAIILLFVLSTSAVFAQADSVSVSTRRSELQRELDQVEEEIAGQQVFLDSKQRERVSLERDVDILEGKIYKSQLSIRARNLSINKLTGNIAGKESAISSLDLKLAREKNSLAQLIRKTSHIDDFSLVEIALGNKNLSEFFEDLDSFNFIKAALGESFLEIELTKATTQKEKLSLVEVRTEEHGLRSIQVLEKQKIERQESEVEEILYVTKGEEAVYQRIISDKQKTAAQIRTELFTLRGSAAIPFEKALDLANLASSLTDVRPALILGTIREESNLGENVGTGNWIADMHPERDRYIFKYITERLGLDPNQMPVSKKPWYGWGGAMGPAQFIPSTWALYAGYDCSRSAQTCTYNQSKDRIGKITGQFPPSPWDPKVAFIASGLLLSDNGADRGTRAAERLAALRYFAGWKNATKREYAFYGEEVMGLADFYQELIDTLSQG